MKFYKYILNFFLASLFFISSQSFAITAQDIENVVRILVFTQVTKVSIFDPYLYEILQIILEFWPKMLTCLKSLQLIIEEVHRVCI